MPLLETKGAASAQGFGGAGAGASGPVTYIEDVFSTYLYTGNGSTQTITNGINLSGEGGLVWGKNRAASWDHYLADTTQGVGKFLSSNTSSATTLDSTSLTAFNSNGFSIGNAGAFINNNGVNYASWTFRKQPKFFDVVTYTGNGSSNRDIAHSLAGNVGFLIVKRTSSTANWAVLARAATQFYASDPGGSSSGLNLTGALGATGDFAMATSTIFKVGSVWWGIGANNETLNNSGETYVAYLFAHDAGGFGLTGTDNVISCGSYTGNGLTDGPVINLSYEPQWVMIKRTDSTGNWALIDNMRGFPDTGSAGNYDNGLLANTSGAETTTSLRVKPTSTGFSPVGGDAGTNASGGTYIYIAIRRGPMKVPTSGTSVFSPNTSAALSGTISTGFPVDLSINSGRVGTNDHFAMDRLRGDSTNYYNYLVTNTTAAEASGTGNGLGFDNNTGFVNNWSSASYVWWNFRRAPGFFDEVCYTASLSTGTAIAHNLQAAPELVICKSRGAGALDSGWMVWSAYTSNKGGYLNTTAAFSNGFWASGISPTATSVYADYQLIGGNNSVTEVAYLFATCAGVSKVGSYTGNGSSQTINCSFTGGARLVLIKRTDSTGDWYVWDTARGIVAGNDPHLSLNSTAAEVTTDDSIDTDSTGFIINQLAATNINVSSATYIYLAIA